MITERMMKMKIIKPYAEILDEINGKEILKKIEKCGRVCYKSEGKIADGSAERFVENIVKCGHEAVLEHASITVKFVVDRGVSHEIVRHRSASYCQESTRYCNYSKDDFGTEITVIEPFYLDKGTMAYENWKISCLTSECKYFELLDWGCTAQEARAVLPNSWHAREVSQGKTCKLPLLNDIRAVHLFCRSLPDGGCPGSPQG